MHDETDNNQSVASGPVAAPSGRLTVKRGGHSITSQIPKPVVLIDSREQLPFDFSRFPNWIAGHTVRTFVQSPALVASASSLRDGNDDSFMSFRLSHAIPKDTHSKSCTSCATAALGGP